MSPATDDNPINKRAPLFKPTYIDIVVRGEERLPASAHGVLIG